MKAIIAEKYGHPSTLTIAEVQIPAPKKGEVLVKVHATTVNDFDWSLVTGKPSVYRLLFGLTRPKTPIPGIELSGTVEALGEGVTTLLPGDAVYGDMSDQGWGAWAEYVCVRASELVLKPASLSFEAAAATAHAAGLAWQGLKLGGIREGMDILVNGAGGGMGMFAAPFARQYDAELTGVDSAEKFETMTSIGYQHLIDYRKEDFTRSGKQYDLILDAKSTRSPRAYLRALKPGGQYVTVGGTPGRLAAIQFSKGWLARRTGKQLHILALKPNQGMEEVNRMYEAGQLSPVIDGPYSMEDIPRLVEYFGKGEHVGKVVVKMG